jgi:hypothetical protein
LARRNGRQHGAEVGALRLVVWSPEEARGSARSVVLRWAEGDDRPEDRLRRAEARRANKLLDLDGAASTHAVPPRGFPGSPAMPSRPNRPDCDALLMRVPELIKRLEERLAQTYERLAKAGEAAAEGSRTEEEREKWCPGEGRIYPPRER